MSKRTKLPPDAKSGADMKTGKGWRLVTPKKARAHKATLVTTYKVGRDRFAVFQVSR